MLSVMINKTSVIAKTYPVLLPCPPARLTISSLCRKPTTVDTSIIGKITYNLKIPGHCFQRRLMA